MHFSPCQGATVVPTFIPGNECGLEVNAHCGPAYKPAD